MISHYHDCSIVANATAKQSDWKSVINAALSLENVADKALVIEAVAICLLSNMDGRRQELMKEARTAVQQIPSELDQIEGISILPKMYREPIRHWCRKLIADAAAELGQAQEDVPRER